MLKRVLVILAFAMALTACGKGGITHDPLKEFKGQSAQQLYNKGTYELAKKNYNTAIKELEALDSIYPFGQYSQQTRLDLIYAYYKLAANELQVANFYYVRGAYVASADRAAQVILHYQGTPQVVESLAVMVESYRALHLDDLADQTLAVLAQNFPNSPQYQDLKP